MDPQLHGLKKKTPGAKQVPPSLGRCGVTDRSLAVLLRYWYIFMELVLCIDGVLVLPWAA